MSEEHEQSSSESQQQQHTEGQGRGITNLWIVVGAPAFAIVGFWLASDHGIVWGVLAAVGGALAATIVTPLVVTVLVTAAHVGIRIEGCFKPFPPSAQAVKGMPALRAAEDTESPTVVCRFDCRPYGRTKAVVLLLLVLGGIIVVPIVLLESPITAGGVGLTKTQVRILLGVYALASLFVLIGFGWIVYVVLTCDRRVVLTNGSLTIPRDPYFEFSRGEIEIPLESISNVSVHDSSGSSQLLLIKHQSGVNGLPSSMFHKGREFAELAWVLTEGIANRESVSRPT